MFSASLSYKINSRKSSEPAAYSRSPPAAISFPLTPIDQILIRNIPDTHISNRKEVKVGILVQFHDEIKEQQSNPKSIADAKTSLEVGGIEPPTSRMQSERSTLKLFTELIAVICL